MVRKPEQPNEKALFLNCYGRRIGRCDVTSTLKRYALASGITNKRVYPHLMRIFGITHLAQKGINLKIIQQQSRHSDIKTLMGYVQPTEQETKNEYLKGISLYDETPTKPIQPDIKPQKPQPKPKINTSDKTDKYIALLKDGLIGKGDFLKLINKDDNDTTTNEYIY